MEAILGLQARYSRIQGDDLLRFDGLCDKKWASVTNLQKLLVFSVLKILHATSWEDEDSTKSGLRCKTSNAAESVTSNLATFQGYCKKPNDQGQSQGDGDDFLWQWTATS